MRTIKVRIISDTRVKEINPMPKPERINYHRRPTLNTFEYDLGVWEREEANCRKFDIAGNVVEMDGEMIYMGKPLLAIGSIYEAEVITKKTVKIIKHNK